MGDQLRSKTLRAEKELEKPNHPLIGQTHLSLCSVLWARPGASTDFEGVEGAVLALGDSRARGRLQITGLNGESGGELWARPGGKGPLETVRPKVQGVAMCSHGVRAGLWSQLAVPSPAPALAGRGAAGTGFPPL